MIQLAQIAVPLSYVSEHIFLFHFILSALFSIFILRAKYSPSTTIAWLTIIIAIPYIGIPLYLFFSRRKTHRQRAEKEPLFAQEEIPLIRENIKIEILGSGEEIYTAITKLIAEAKESISLSIFIFANDAAGKKILASLEKKASEGITVKILLDSFGSIWVRPPSFKKLKSLGAEVGFFMPIWQIPFLHRYNLRNHRKILVVDGDISLLGGMNIASEYMGGARDKERWAELGLIIHGESSADLEVIFSKDWRYATGKKYAAFSRLISNPPKNINLAQIIASGPDLVGDRLYDDLLTMIFKANKKIWIASPYFIPDETLAKALMLAAKRGIDIKILLPYKSNHFLADLARGSYLAQLAEAGCQIFYLQKMLHAKAILFDENCVLVGSANFDMRSLLYNYEVGIYLFSAIEIARMESWFCNHFEAAKQEAQKHSYLSELSQGIGKALGPLL